MTKEPKRNEAVYLALGVRPDGTKEILGLWIEQSEGAKFWLRVMDALKTRGVEDVLIAVVDGLKGSAQARPLTRTLTRLRQFFRKPRCRHASSLLIRHALAFVSCKDRKAVAAALRKIYKAKDAEAGLAELDGFADGPRGQKYPAIA